MGCVFRKKVTKPLPARAEIFERKGQRHARWKDKNGKTKTAPLTTGKDGTDRIVIETSKYYAEYRDGSDIVRTVPTGCRDEQAARKVLSDLESIADKVRSGALTIADVAIKDQQHRPVGEVLDAYADHLRRRGRSAIHRDHTDRYLRRLATECPFKVMKDLKAEALDQWLDQHGTDGMGAKTRNLYRGAMIAFANWCVDSNRLSLNPFTAVEKANDKADRRRHRRSMTEPELVQLLFVARDRPLLEALTVRRGPRKGERYAKVRPEVRDRLNLLGRERALIYKTLVLTGLRRNELSSLTVAHLDLDADVPFLTLDPSAEKNRQGNDIALRDDLAADLRAWLATKLQRLQDAAREAGDPIPVRLPSDTPVFTVPVALVKILDRDLRLAGIPKRDERGRTLDVHALRTTFGTLLSKGGVAPRTAQAAMRHSDIRLTMGTYTDPKLLDVRGALDTLPALSLDPADCEADVVGAQRGAVESLQ